MTIADNSQQKIDITVQLSEVCYEPIFILHGEKITKTTLKGGVDTAEPVIDKTSWSKTFSLQNIGEGTNVDYSNIKVTIDKMELNSRKYMTLKFVDRDDDRKDISDGNVKNVKLTIQNPTMLRFLDSNNPIILTYSGNSEKKILLQSNFKGGTALIQVEATINGKDIKNMFAITILSGPINSMSIVLEKSEKKDAFYHNTYKIHPVDEYGNRANKGEKIYVGVVNGLRQTSDSATSYLYSDNNGRISINGSETVFHSNLPLNEVDINLDKVVILANNNRMYPDYLGGWSIADKTTNSDLSNGILYLNEDYTGKNSIRSDKLKFIIGNERRYNMCLDSYSVADIDMDNNIYEIDKNGDATMKLTYDPYLLGNSVYIYANTMPKTEEIFDGNGTKITKRVGVAINDVLHGTGLTASPLTESFTCNPPKDENNITVAGATKYATLVISLKSDTDFAKNVIIGVTASGDCYVTGRHKIDGNLTNLSNTGCDGLAEFDIVIPSSENCECEIQYTGIYKDTGIKHHD